MIGFFHIFFLHYSCHFWIDLNALFFLRRSFLFWSQCNETQERHQPHKATGSSQPRIDTPITSLPLSLFLSLIPNQTIPLSPCISQLMYHKTITNRNPTFLLILFFFTIFFSNHRTHCVLMCSLQHQSATWAQYVRIEKPERLNQNIYRISLVMFILLA